MAKFVEYNLNPRKRGTEDCIFRALSLFFGVPWREALDEYINYGAKNGRTNFQTKNYITWFLKIKKLVKLKTPRPAVTVGEFCERIAEPGKRYLVLTRTHMTTVLNKAIYDTWDCSERKVTGCWTEPEPGTEQPRVPKINTGGFHFLVQVTAGQVTHDFAWRLCRSREYLEWHGDNIEIRFHEGTDFSDVDNPDVFTPVGSVEFVSEYLRTFHPDAVHMLKPLNVPEKLFPYAGRPVRNILKESDMPKLEENTWLFLKSLSTIKDPENGPRLNPTAAECVGYQISPMISIISEWRAFVFNGKVLDIRNYSGDPFVCPDKDTVTEMVEEFTDAPVTYTLDVAVTTGNKTVVVECHRFFSCGLYGFRDDAKLAPMLSQTWFQMKTTKKE